jgi:peptidoglycan/LPS O-acetylase OafA/YrhL
MQQKRSRLISLDGIRGLAMILVFLNHIDPTFVSNLLPPSLGIISSTIFSSGVLGVSFLFILTGFLMAYIYNQPSEKLLFLQKRYTRILPLFLTLSVAMLILRNTPKISYLITVPLIIGLSFLANFLWVNVVKKINRQNFSKVIFISFLILQVVIGFIYLFVIMKFPPVVFNHQIPSLVREGMIGLINSTLTLPLGNYVPMLDGVYWSLTSEILFYVLYPTICVPFILYLASKKRITKIVFLITLIPLFAGAEILSRKILVISMLQISLFSYFVVGMALGYLYRKKEGLFEKLNFSSQKLLNYWSVVLFVIILILPHILQKIIPANFHPLINLLWALPFGTVIMLALNSKTALSKMLSSKFLIFIGMISYSIYLTHTPILHMVQDVFHASNFLTNTISILLSFGITVAISMLTFRLLEKPYFIKPKFNQKPINAPMNISKGRISAIISIMLGVYLLAVFSAFQSDFNFFSMQVPYSSNVLISPKVNANTSTVPINGNSKIIMQFKAKENNLGVITMSIDHKTARNKLVDLDSQLFFRIKEKGSSSWYSQSGYDLYKINGASVHHPFGFPLIVNSKDRTYVVELYLSNPSSGEYVVLDIVKNSMKTVYPINKMQLIRDPVKLMSFVENRITTVVGDRDARYVFFLFLPFLSISLYLIFSKR